MKVSQFVGNFMSVDNFKVVGIEMQQQERDILLLRVKTALIYN